MPAEVCEIENCKKAPLTGSICQMHRNRIRRHGDPHQGGKPVRRNADGSWKTCSVRHCLKPVLAKDLCNGHYQYSLGQLQENPRIIQGLLDYLEEFKVD